MANVCTKEPGSIREAKNPADEPNQYFSLEYTKFFSIYKLAVRLLIILVNMGCLCSGQTQISLHTSDVPRRRSFDSSYDLESPDKNYISLTKLTFHQVYDLEPNPIGGGLHGEIRKCRHRRTKEERVVKIISKVDNDNKNSVLYQVNTLRGLDHPNILKLTEFFEGKNDYYLVLEYLNGGDLCDKMTTGSKFDERQSCSALKQILSGISYMHSKNLVHRDIKPENILIADNKDGGDMCLKIIDFDLVIRCPKGTILKEVIGTVDYMAPEVFAGNYNEKCDV